MIIQTRNQRFRPYVRAIAAMVAFCFGANLPVPVQAAELLNLPQPGAMVTTSAGFAPAAIKGIKIFPDNPLRFDFVIDTGDSGLKDQALQDESSRLIKYFLAALTIPENDMWVNLSPYEKDRIVPNSFGVTEMGRDLLAQDYLLKQLTSTLMYPEEELGKGFWDKVYQKAYLAYGSTDIPVNTFNKVWIVPEKAVVYAKGDTAYVVESKLKVMLEEDYLIASNVGRGTRDVGRDVGNGFKPFPTEVIREILIPEIEKEVNAGKNFATLRQVYNATILATWFKRNLKESVLGEIYVGKNKVSGVDVEDKAVKEKIYQQYLEAFKKGVYNYIKEDFDPATQQVIPRKYFSGGILQGMQVDQALMVTQDEKMLVAASPAADHAILASAVLEPATVKDHQRYHDEGNFSEVIQKIAEEIKAEKRSDAKYDLRAAAMKNDDQKILTSFGEVRIEGDNVLIIVDSRFGKDHGGLDELAVYARNEQKVVHEISEVRDWRTFALKQGIATASDIEQRQLGQKVRAWAKENSEEAEKQNKTFHEKALREELISTLREKLTQAQIDVLMSKLTAEMTAYILAENLSVEIRGGTAAPVISDERNILSLSQQFLVEHSAEFFAYSSQRETYRHLTGENTVTAEFAAELLSILPLVQQVINHESLSPELKAMLRENGFVDNEGNLIDKDWQSAGWPEAIMRKVVRLIEGRGQSLPVGVSVEQLMQQGNNLLPEIVKKLQVQTEDRIVEQQADYDFIISSEGERGGALDDDSDVHPPLAREGTVKELPSARRDFFWKTGVFVLAAGVFGGIMKLVSLVNEEREEEQAKKRPKTKEEIRNIEDAKIPQYSPVTEEPLDKQIAKIDAKVLAGEMTFFLGKNDAQRKALLAENFSLMRGSNKGDERILLLAQRLNREQFDQLVFQAIRNKLEGNDYWKPEIRKAMNDKWQEVTRLKSISDFQQQAKTIKDKKERMSLFLKILPSYTNVSSSLSINTAELRRLLELHGLSDLLVDYPELMLLPEILAVRYNNKEEVAQALPKLKILNEKVFRPNGYYASPWLYEGFINLDWKHWFFRTRHTFDFENKTIVVVDRIVDSTERLTAEGFSSPRFPDEPALVFHEDAADFEKKIQQAVQGIKKYHKSVEGGEAIQNEFNRQMTLLFIKAGEENKSLSQPGVIRSLDEFATALHEFTHIIGETPHGELIPYLVSIAYSDPYLEVAVPSHWLMNGRDSLYSSFFMPIAGVRPSFQASNEDKLEAIAALRRMSTADIQKRAKELLQFKAPKIYAAFESDAGRQFREQALAEIKAKNGVVDIAPAVTSTTLEKQGAVLQKQSFSPTVAVAGAVVAKLAAELVENKSLTRRSLFGLSGARESQEDRAILADGNNPLTFEEAEKKGIVVTPSLAETDATSDEFQKWYAPMQEFIAEKYNAIDKLLGEQKQFAMDVYLLSLQNTEESVMKMRSLITSPSDNVRSTKKLLELEAGSTAVAEAIAKKNEGEMDVIATDEWDSNPETAQKEYLQYGQDFEHGQLIAQKSSLGNIVAIRAYADLIRYIPDKSLDYILLVNPSRAIIKDLVVLIREFGLADKLKPTGQIIIKTGQSVEQYLGLISAKFDFTSSDNFNMFGIDLHETADWEDDIFKGKLYIVTPKDNAALVQVDQHVGGIDINPNKISIQTEGEGIKFNKAINTQELEKLKSTPLDGFSPVILQIVPINNVPLLFGVNAQAPPKPPALAAAAQS